MSPEVISQASYSTILTIAFDLRHRLEYLTFGDKERQLFNFRFLHRLYGERCTCKSCGASGAAHIPNESEHLNLSGYLMEWGVVGHIKGKCICCGAPFSHYSCESRDICKLDQKFRIYGIELKWYSMKATHHSLLHNMMELVLLESIDDDKQRQEAFAAISSFMHLGVKRVSDLWCRPDYHQIRKDKFERWKQDTLLVPGSHPHIPPQSYRSYFEMYEMLSRSFVENSVAVASALDLIQYALVDNPSVRNFKMILGAAMMYLNRFQEFIRLHDPKEFMIPSDPLYQQVKHRFITSDLSIVKRMLVIIMIYEMPQFFHYGDFVRVANGEKDMFTHGGVDLCRCLVKQGRILDNDKLKRSKKGKDDLMRQQLRIKNIRIGQVELEDIPRQFVRYFGQNDQAPNLLLALKALNLENKVQQMEVLQPRGSPPSIVLDLAKLPRRVLLCHEKVVYPEVTEVMKVQEEAIWYRIDKYIQILKKKKNRNKEDLFEFDEEFYKIDIDPKILKKFERLGFNVSMESDPEDTSSGEGGKTVPSSTRDDKDESLSAGETDQSTTVATPIKEEVTPLASYLPLEKLKSHPEGLEEEHTHRTTDVPPLLSSGQVSTPALSGDLQSVESSADSRENVREKERQESRSVRSKSNSKSKSTAPNDEEESSTRSSTQESVGTSGKDKVSEEEPPPSRHQEGGEASEQREQSELVTVDLSEQEVDTLIEKADVIVVIMPKKGGKSAGTTPKRTKRVASLPPTRYQKIVSIPSEKSKKVASTPSEEMKKVTSTPSEKAKKIASTPSEETKKVASTPSEETKKVASTPSEETKKVASTPSEETKKVASTPSEETKKVASTPSEEMKRVAHTPSEETKKVASTPSEETKKAASTPSEEMKKVASTPSEETKKVASTPSEEMKKVTSTPSEETKEVASTPLEETKKVTHTPSEENKTIAVTPLEETKIVAESPSEETKNVAGSPSEETKIVAESPSEETKNVVNSPSDESKTVADSPSKETKNVADSPSKETKNVADSPSEETKNVADSPSEETKNLVDSPSEETKNVADNLSEETKNVADSPSKETKNVASTKQEKSDSGNPVGGSSPTVEQRQPHSSSQRSCAYCGGVREKLLRCKRCKLVFYCHSNCQKAHWKTHKINCISTS